MTAYIKFCGGCNETYPRGSAAKLIKNNFCDRIDFITHDRNVPADIGILIMGCGRECVKLSDLAPCKRLVTVTSMQECEKAISLIDNYLSEPKA